MYSVMVRHYDVGTQKIQSFTVKHKAEKYMNEQIEIMKGYFSSWGWIGNEFHFFQDDVSKSVFWVKKEKK